MDELGSWIAAVLVVAAVGWFVFGLRAYLHSRKQRRKWEEYQRWLAAQAPYKRDPVWVLDRRLDRRLYREETPRAATVRRANVRREDSGSTPDFMPSRTFEPSPMPDVSTSPVAEFSGGGGGFDGGGASGSFD